MTADYAPNYWDDFARKTVTRLGVRFTIERAPPFSIFDECGAYIQPGYGYRAWAGRWPCRTQLKASPASLERLWSRDD